jgi:hypothetical protein
MERQERTRNQLLNDLQETTAEAQGRTVWRNGFGRGYGPVMRLTTESTNLLK